MTNMTLRCEKCGREAGPEMVDCPERAVGACAYELRQGSAIGRRYAVGCLVIFGFVFVFVTISVGAAAGWHWGAGAAVVLILLGIVATFARQVSLFNPETGAMWQRVDVLGAELACTVVERLRPHDLDLSPMRPLEIPASTAVLTTESATAISDAVAAARASGGRPSPDVPKPPSRDGVHVFTAALAGLLAQDAVRVSYGRMLKRRFKLRGMRLVDEEDVTYLLQPGERTGAVTGALEQRILDGVIHWDQQPAHAEWPQGAPIYELVYALFDRSKTDPDRWLASFAVDEAAGLGLGRMVKGQESQEGSLPPRGVVEKLARFVDGLAGHFEVNPAYEQQMDEQREIVLDLIRQMEDADAAFMEKLRQETRRAIDAREESSD